ncbi:protein FAR1-RELATED SEQUENCE 5-like [Sesbania bispinosa]|nr:protein FAR1-RELATED SEQUENCE 5-like [Sesbania bispinosa]
MYQKREMWAATYMRGKISAGFRTTSRCESLHSELAKFVHSRHDLTISYITIIDVLSICGSEKWKMSFPPYMVIQYHKPIFKILKVLQKATSMNVVACRDLYSYSLYTVCKRGGGTKIRLLITHKIENRNQMNPIPHGKSTLNQIKIRNQKSSVNQIENPKPTKNRNQINPTPNQNPEPKIILSFAKPSPSLTTKFHIVPHCAGVTSPSVASPSSLRHGGGASAPCQAVFLALSSLLRTSVDCGGGASSTAKDLPPLSAQIGLGILLLLSSLRHGGGASAPSSCFSRSLFAEVSVVEELHATTVSHKLLSSKCQRRMGKEGTETSMAHKILCKPSFFLTLRLSIMGSYSSQHIHHPFFHPPPPSRAFSKRVCRVPTNRRVVDEVVRDGHLQVLRGSQHRNKRESSVRLKHLPTGMFAQVFDLFDTKHNRILGFGEFARGEANGCCYTCGVWTP